MRRLGIKQWPYRKRTSAKKITHSLEVGLGRGWGSSCWRGSRRGWEGSRHHTKAELKLPEADRDGMSARLDEALEKLRRAKASLLGRQPLDGAAKGPARLLEMRAVVQGWVYTFNGLDIQPQAASIQLECPALQLATRNQSTRSLTFVKKKQQFAA